MTHKVDVQGLNGMITNATMKANCYQQESHNLVPR